MSRRTALIASAAIGLVAIAAGAWLLFGGDRTPEYASVAEIVDAMRDGGAPCEDMRLLDEEHDTLAEFGLCFLESSREHEIDIYVFDDADDRDTWLFPGSNLEPLAKVVGPNWVITTGTRANATLIQEAIGGRVDDAPSPR